MFYYEWMCCVCVLAFKELLCALKHSFNQKKINSRNWKCVENMLPIPLLNQNIRERWREKNHLQIFSQQHSIVNGHYAFLLLFPLPLAILCLRTVPISYARAYFLQAHELIPILISLVYDVCVRFIHKQNPIDSHTNHIVDLVQLHILHYFTYEFHSLVEPKNPVLLWILMRRDLLAHGYNNLRKCTNTL